MSTEQLLKKIAAKDKYISYLEDELKKANAKLRQLNHVIEEQRKTKKISS